MPELTPDDENVQNAQDKNNENQDTAGKNATDATTGDQRNASKVANETATRNRLSPEGGVATEGTNNMRNNPDIQNEVPDLILDLFDELSNEYEKNKNANDSFETVMDNTLKNGETKYTEKQKQAMSEFLEKVRQEGSKNLEKVAPKTLEKAKKALKDILDKRSEDKITNKNIKDVMKDFDSWLDDNMENTSDSDIANEIEKFKKKLDDLNTKRIQEGKPPERKWSLKDLVKLLSILSFLSMIGVGIWALLGFCNNNTGCMQVSLTSENAEQTSEKILCSGTISYASQNCYCLTKPPTTTKDITDVSMCKDSITTPEYNNPHCLNNESLQDKYVYYTYRVMDPITGLGTILKDIGAAAGSAFDKIIKVLKTVGWIILALMIAYIVFKIVTKFVI